MLSSIIRMEKQIYRVKWPRFLALLTWENMIRSLPYWLLILGFSNLVYYKYFKLKMYCNKLTSKARIVWNMLVERALDCSICFCHISFSHSPPWWICYSFTAAHFLFIGDNDTFDCHLEAYHVYYAFIFYLNVLVMKTRFPSLAFFIQTLVSHMWPWEH